MADRYFDRNGTTAGFGILTGNWDTTTASWSTSAAGTATPAAYTFTTADTANFGSSTGASTAGTATIQNGITVNLNRLVFTVTGAQTVAATGTGNLTFGGVNPTVVSQGVGQPVISAPINFPNGLSFQPGSSALQLTNIGQAGNSGFVNISDGTVYCLATGSGTPDQLKGATAFALTHSSIFTSLQYYGSNAYTEPAAISAVFADAASISISSHNNAGVTLSHSSVGTWTGSFAALAYLTTTLTGRLVLNTAPAAAGFLYLQSSGQTTGQTGIAPVIAFSHSGTATIGATVYLYAGQASTALAAANLCLEQNSSSLTTFSGNVINQAGSNSSAFQWLRLTGTGLSAITGNFTATTGTNGLRKLGTGQWSLSGNNTYTGSTLIEAGTLVGSSNTALGAATSSGSSTISGTGQLVVSGGYSVNKSLTDFSVTNTSNPIQASGGTGTFRTKGLSLASSATTTFNVASGDTLVLSTENAGVISGTSAAITKTGVGTLRLPASANTYTGAVTVTQGVLEVGSVANASVAAAWGAASSAVAVSSTLSYIGATGSSSRAVQMTGSAPTLDASGAGALTLSNVTQDTTAKTMTVRGTNSDANTISSAIANNTGVVSLAKEDAGKWVLSGALSYTGTTAVNGGTLRVQTANSNTISGAVTIGASGTVELVTDTLASTSASSGEVLGTGNVTVSGGVVKTRGGGTQKGQVRYGGNLTFGAGSTLYIGAAA